MPRLHQQNWIPRRQAARGISTQGAWQTGRAAGKSLPAAPAAAAAARPRTACGCARTPGRSLQKAGVKRKKSALSQRQLQLFNH